MRKTRILLTSQAQVSPPDLKAPSIATFLKVSTSNAMFEWFMSTVDRRNISLHRGEDEAEKPGEIFRLSRRHQSVDL